MHCQDNLDTSNKSETANENSFSKLIPSDKKLSSQWVNSLTDTSDTEVFSGEELKYIGMPIGGIFTGQVYLGGDGQLWHWDIFKDYGGAEEHADPRGPHYASPLEKKSPFEQGFALEVNGRVIPLNSKGFSDIKFRGQYPIGNINYEDNSLEIKAKLQAYSPFIPLDSKNSGLPLTVLEYTVENTSEEEIEVSLLGWLENKVCPYEPSLNGGFRENKTFSCDHYTFLSTKTKVPDGIAGTGSMSLAILSNGEKSSASAKVGNFLDGNEYNNSVADVNSETSEVLIGGVKSSIKVAANSKHKFTAIVSWYYPEYTGGDVLFATLGDDKFYSSMDIIEGLTC